MQKYPNILVSHAYAGPAGGFWETFMTALGRDGMKLLMDSGAFTARTTGKEVTLDGYCARVDRIGDAIWQYIMLDVIMDEKASLENLAEMVRRGYKPMPVLTEDASLDNVPGFVEINEHICVAGGVGAPTEQYSARIEQVWRRSGGRAKIHGLGYTRGLAPLKSRVATIDSSTWMVGQRFGNLTIYHPTLGHIQQKNFNHYIRGKPMSKWPKGVAQLLMRSGVRPKDIGSPDANRGPYSLVNLLTVHAWTLYARDAKRSGVDLFFAAGGYPQTLNLLALGWRYTDEHGRFDYQAAKAAVPKAQEIGETRGYMESFLEVMNG